MANDSLSVVLYDPDLMSLLKSAKSLKKPPGKFLGQDHTHSTSNIPTDNSEHTHTLTHNSHIHTVESNLNEMSHLICATICKLVPLNVSKLNIYLFIPNKHHLLSTILLNYIKSLYSSVLVNAPSHGFTNELEILLKIDLTILPICDFKAFKQVHIVGLDSINGLDTSNDSSINDTPTRFLYLNNRFMCKQFYMARDFCGSSAETNFASYEAVTHYSLSSLSQTTDSNTNYTHQCSSFSDVSQTLLNSELPGFNSQNVVFFVKRLENIMFCGTFDYLHYGHKLLLLSAFLSCTKNLFIGVVASDELISAKTDYEKVEALETRKRRVSEYLNELQALYENPLGWHDLVKSDADLSYTNENSGADNGTAVGILDGTHIYNYMSIDFNILCDGGPNNSPIWSNKSPAFSRSNESATDAVIYNQINVTIFDLLDLLGPSTRFEEKFGLLVTPEIVKNGQYVNEERIKLNLEPWDLMLVGLVCYLKGDELIKLSSSSIRRVI